MPGTVATGGGRLRERLRRQRAARHGAARGERRKAARRMADFTTIPATKGRVAYARQRGAVAVRIAATVSRDDGVDADRAELGARAARIAGDAVGGGGVARMRSRAHERGSTASVSDVSASPACVPISSSR